MATIADFFINMLKRPKFTFHPVFAIDQGLAVNKWLVYVQTKPIKSTKQFISIY